MKTHLWLILCALLPAILLLSGCSQTAPPPSTTATGTEVGGPAATADEPLSGEIVDGVREVKVEAFKYGFKPDRIIVKKGETVRLLGKSTDVEHGIAIPDMKLELELPPQKEKVLEFTPDKAGEFPFHCSEYCGPGHKDMKGTLVVKE